MISGKKLKKLRRFKNLTQKELATKSGLNYATVRGYETGSKTYDIDELQKIADALECDIGALLNHEPISVFEIMHIIFDYEEDLSFQPLVKDGEPISLISYNTDFNSFLIEWDKMRKKHHSGEISDEEFEEWKLTYPKNLDI